jgi:hypothetical protein
MDGVTREVSADGDAPAVNDHVSVHYNVCERTQHLFFILFFLPPLPITLTALRPPRRVPWQEEYPPTVNDARAAALAASVAAHMLGAAHVKEVAPVMPAEVGLGCTSRIHVTHGLESAWFQLLT